MMKYYGKSQNSLFNGTTIHGYGKTQPGIGLSVVALDSLLDNNVFSNSIFSSAIFLDQYDSYKNYQLLYNTISSMMGPKAYLASANQPAGVQGSVFGTNSQPTYTYSTDTQVFQHVFPTSSLPEFQAIDRAILETLYDLRMPRTTSQGYDSLAGYMG